MNLDSILSHLSPFNPIIAIDWNSTIQNQIGEICQRTCLHHADFREWNPQLGHRVGMSQAAFDTWAWTDPTIQWMADPYPGAVATINELMYHAQIWIVTSTSNPLLVAPWLRKHKIRYDKIIITTDKGSAEWDGKSWDVLIDDNPFTLSDLCETRRVLRHPVGWNEYLMNIEAFSWNEV